MISLEDCLRRIAARLCQLDAAHLQLRDVKADNRCKPQAEDKDDCANDCCKPPPAVEVKDSCADDCCTPSADDKYSCTDDKKNREDQKAECTYTCCETTSQDAFTESSPTCNAHLQAAFARFESLIRQGQCLCRRLMSEMNFCCCSTDTTSCKSHTDDRKPVLFRPNECQTESFSKNAKATAGKSQEQQRLSEAVAFVPSHIDAESSAAREQVVLNVSGMTCTGCSKKLMNVLDGISGISNPTVTFVSGTASFEYDNHAGKIGLDAIQSLVEKQTGFKVSRVISDYQHVDLLIEPSVAQQLERESVDGFVSVENVCPIEISGAKLIGTVSHCLTSTPRTDNLYRYVASSAIVLLTIPW